MRRWLVYLCGILALIMFRWLPFRGTDLSSLLPVQLVRLSYSDGEILIETDESYYGIGDSVALALEDLERSTPGKIFLQTADFLIVDPDASSLLEDIAQHLRPACGICKDGNVEDLKSAAKFLSANEPELTIRKWKLGERNMQMLRSTQGRMELVW